MLSKNNGVYTAQVDAVFLAPTPTDSGNPIEGRSDSLIYFAAIVEREFNEGQVTGRLATPDATLAGAGVRQGYTVTMPNVGGQWQTNFGRPVLSVEVVDSSPELVRTVLSDQVNRIRELTDGLQQSVAPANRIRVGLSPAEAQVAYVGGSRSKVLVGVAAIGFMVTVAALRLMEMPATGGRWKRPHVRLVSSRAHRSRSPADDRESRAATANPT